MIDIIISIIKSIYASAKLCPDVSSLKMPVRVSYNTVLKSLSGHLTTDGKTFPALRIGFDKVGIFDKTKSRPILQKDGEMIINGRANFGQGAKINIGPNGTLTLGNNFNNTAETAIICQEKNINRR